MAIHPRQFGIVLKNARMDKKLTQAELAEILDISLPYLKDLERFRNNPSYDVFEKVIRYFNLSADTVIYPNENLTNTTYQQIERLLTRCDEGQLRVILATTEALFTSRFSCNFKGSSLHRNPPAKMSLFVTVSVSSIPLEISPAGKVPDRLIEGCSLHILGSMPSAPP